MTRALLTALAVLLLASPAFTLEPIPDKLVVLTFDDSAKSHHTVARPILAKYKFGATFFITEGFDFPTNKKDYMTWEEIAQLHKDGFEIGNHTLDHKGVTEKTLADLPAQLRGISAQCKKHGIPQPTSFAYPGPPGRSTISKPRWRRRSTGKSRCFSSTACRTRRTTG